ncbi:hypothetical protein K523DRAFT_103435 [Schizophyllum commune Tattone D]|nr:hypothetical protein K523DRAFT_103435 [Schizophyllum commune Tattone D]
MLSKRLETNSGGHGVPKLSILERRPLYSLASPISDAYCTRMGGSTASYRTRTSRITQLAAFLQRSRCCEFREFCRFRRQYLSSQ